MSLHVFGENAALLQQVPSKNSLPKYFKAFDTGWLSAAIAVNEFAINGVPKHLIYSFYLPKKGRYRDSKKMLEGASACLQNSGVAVSQEFSKTKVEYAATSIVLGSYSPFEACVKAGDVLAVTGTLGAAGAAQVALAKKNWTPARNHLLYRAVKPPQRIKEILLLREQHAHAIALIKTGLAIDANALAPENTRAVVNEKNIPIDRAVMEVSEETEINAIYFANNAPDYEVLAALEPKKFGQAQAELRKNNCRLTAIGEFTQV